MVASIPLRPGERKRPGLAFADLAGPGARGMRDTAERQGQGQNQGQSGRQKKAARITASRCGIGRRPTFPPSSGSIIGAAGLNFSVRNGKRCAPALLSPQSLCAASCSRVRDLTMSEEGKPRSSYLSALACALPGGGDAPRMKPASIG